MKKNEEKRRKKRNGVLFSENRSIRLIDQLIDETGRKFSGSFLCSTRKRSREVDKKERKKRKLKIQKRRMKERKKKKKKEGGGCVSRYFLEGEHPLASLD